MEDYLLATEFEFELAKALQKLIPEHMRICLEDTDIDFEDYGSDVQKKLKLISKYYSNFSVVLRDIDLSLKFLGKDRESILEHYPFLDCQKTFFSYHYENYFIRLVTLLDLVVKLGTIVYGFNINLNYVNANKFNKKARSEGNENIAKIIEKLTYKLNNLKEERHKKLHTGESDIKPFNGVVIWEDFDAIIGSKTDKLLKLDTDEKIKDEILFLKNSINELVDIIKEFLEESKTKLIEIINTP